MRRLLLRALPFFVLLAAPLAGCSITNVSEGERTEVEYTVLGAGELPPEVEAVLSEQDGGAFQIAYESGGYLYVLRSYGRQKSGGYSIRAEEVYAAGDSLHVKTRLAGPATREEQKGGESCPVIVLKMEAREGLSVVFEE